MVDQLPKKKSILKRVFDNNFFWHQFPNFPLMKDERNFHATKPTLRFDCLDRVDRIFFSAGAFFSFIGFAGGTNAGGGILLPSPFSSSDNSMVGLTSTATISNESFESSFVFFRDSFDWAVFPVMVFDVTGSSIFSFLIRIGRDDSVSATVVADDVVALVAPNAVAVDFSGCDSFDVRSTFTLTTLIVPSRRIFVFNAGSFCNFFFFFQMVFLKKFNLHSNVLNQNAIILILKWRLCSNGTYVTCCLCTASTNRPHQCWLIIIRLIAIHCCCSHYRTCTPR